MIAVTAPPDIVAVAAACTPFVVSFGGPIVTDGAAVYPLPPFVTAIDVIEKPVLTVAVPVAVTPPSVCGAEKVTVGEDSSCSVTKHVH